MSIEVVAWAWSKAPNTNSEAQLLVLLALADDANSDWLTWRSRDEISNKVQLRNETVRIAIKFLEKRKLIRRFARYWYNGRRTSNVYWLSGGPDPSSIDAKVLPRGNIEGLGNGVVEGYPPNSQGDYPPVSQGGLSPRQSGGLSSSSKKNSDPKEKIRTQGRRSPTRIPFVRTRPSLNGNKRIDPDERRRERRRLRRKARKENPTPEGFQKFRSVFPARFGHDPIPMAEGNWNQLIREHKTTPEVLIGKAKWYNKCKELEGKIGTEFVMQMSSFLGPKKAGWMTDWKKQYKLALRNGHSMNGNGRNRSRIGAAELHREDEWPEEWK